MTGVEVKRCPSCEHGADIHDSTGLCWFTVAQGTPEKDLVCPCHVPVDPAKLEPGTRIQYKRVFSDGTRLGSAEPKYVVFATDQHVLYEVYDLDGRCIAESVVTRREYEQTFEVYREPAPVGVETHICETSRCWQECRNREIGL